MKLENQVVSLELAKKLKDLGFKQESLFYWQLGLQIPYLVRAKSSNCCSAYTVAELGEMLPLNIDGFDLQIWREKGKESWDIAYNTDSGNLKIMPWEQSDTEADARAKMLIYLKTNNLI